MSDKPKKVPMKKGNATVSFNENVVDYMEKDGWKKVQGNAVDDPSNGGPNANQQQGKVAR